MLDICTAECERSVLIKEITHLPIYEYQARSPESSCAHCIGSFDVIQKISDPHLKACPKCSSEVVRIISAPSVGTSQSNLDDRAKSSGFHKLKKIGKGEYERQY